MIAKQEVAKSDTTKCLQYSMFVFHTLSMIWSHSEPKNSYGLNFKWQILLPNPNVFM